MLYHQQTEGAALYVDDAIIAENSDRSPRVKRVLFAAAVAFAFSVAILAFNTSGNVGRPNSQISSSSASSSNTLLQSKNYGYLNQLWSQQDKVLCEDKLQIPGTQEAGLGYSLAIQDGLLAIGAPGIDGGAVYFNHFKEHKERWGAMYKSGNNGQITVKNELTLADPNDVGDFGKAVALSDNGKTLVVGAPASNKVFVFMLSGGEWALMTTLSVDEDYAFGTSVDVGGEGTVVVGAPLAPGEDGTAGAGKVYVYDRRENRLEVADASLLETSLGEDCPTDDTDDECDKGKRLPKTYEWVLTDELGCGNKPINYGTSVSICKTCVQKKDEGIILVGATLKNIDNTKQSGAAYVFELSEGRWDRTQLISAAAPQQGAEFGSSVQIGCNGEILVIGALSDDVDNDEIPEGAVYIFEKDSNGLLWEQSTVLTAQDCPNDYSLDYQSFGSSVAIDEHSASILVGAHTATNAEGCPIGLAYVFEKEHTNLQADQNSYGYLRSNWASTSDPVWNRVRVLSDEEGDECNEEFGKAVGISKGVIAVGDWKHNDAGFNEGAVFTFCDDEEE